MQILLTCPYFPQFPMANISRDMDTTTLSSNKQKAHRHTHTYTYRVSDIVTLTTGAVMECRSKRVLCARKLLGLKL